jgi:hypothetical protein
MDIPPPQNGGEYPTAAAAIEFIQLHGKANGYFMITKRSKPDSVKPAAKTAYYLQCDRHSSYQSKSIGIQQSSTKTTGCPFKVVIQRYPGADFWTLDVKDEPHNYNASNNLTAHPGHRRRDIAQIAT